jgi:3-oxoadipate enol-lactonase
VRAGSTIRYWDSGPRDGPTMVLSHGITLDHDAFAPQVPVLEEAGWRVITWDLRGHGESRPMGRRFSVRLAAEDLGLLLDEVGADQAVLVGQSFGGLIVQELYRQRPERVAALVLVGAMALGDRPPWHQRLLHRTRPFLLRAWPERHLRRVTPSFLSRHADVQEYIAQAIAPLSKRDLVEVTEAALEGLLTYEPLDRIDVPVLLVRGEHEMALVAKLIHAWAARERRARLAVVERAGHLANLENPDRFNEILLEFLYEHVAFGRTGAGSDR